MTALQEPTVPGQALASANWRPAAPMARVGRAIPVEPTAERRLGSGPSDGGELLPLLAALRAAMAAVPGVVVHVTSAQPGEGVSMIARELAFAAAGFARGEVLLVEGTASGDGALAKSLSVAAPEPLWAVAESGRLATTRLVRERRSCHLAQLPIDALPDLRMIPVLYTALRATFSLTVVDCPAVLENPDFVNLAEQADGVVLVIEAERTRIPVVERAKAALLASNASMIGVVLNKSRRYIPAFIYRWL